MADVGRVRSEHAFDERALERYLGNKLSGFPKGDGTFTVLQYKEGQSNPTFYLNKSGQEFVLRKKPNGKLLPGAHKVEREFRIMSALHKVSFPVPSPLLFCGDRNAIGTEFYVMEHVKGRIFRDLSLPTVSPSERRAIYRSLVNTLAKLHSIDWRSLGLSNFGPQGNYFRRQVSTWTKQYKASATENIDSMDEAAQCLSRDIPPSPDETVIIHGDFRLDNMIFHPTEPRVIAVLDWELSTLGHPIADLAYLCISYHWPKELEGLLPSFFSGENKGVPSEIEMVSLYCQERGLTTPLPHWNKFIALSYFRMAAIAQGIYKRFLQGNASAENASLFGATVRPLANTALRFAKNNAPTTDNKFPGSKSVAEDISLFNPSPKARALYQKVKTFMKEHIIPAEKVYMEHISKPESQWTVVPVMAQLKAKARKEGLWNFFLPAESGLTQLEYAHLAELTGHSPIAPEVFNCSAPDTGNMEVLHLYGSPEQKKIWLEPLLRGEIRSAYCMTEPDVASSDATNMECEITRDGCEYVINGTKWWSSGAGDPRCKVLIVMGKSAGPDAPRHKRHSMIIVPIDTPGVTKVRYLTVFGYTDAPHGHYELKFKNVRVPLSNMILGEGRGFEIAQGRLGPGRIHHCMRTIGLAEKALEMMCQRAMKREAFGGRLAAKGMVQNDIALSRMEIDQARLLVLKAAHMLDTVGNKAARKEIAMAKVIVPRMACEVVDRAIQVHGGMGVCQDTLLPHFYSGVRSLRIADGPDEVHLTAVAKLELKEQYLRSKM